MVKRKAWIVLWCCVSPAWATESASSAGKLSDPVEILKRAQEAVRQVKAVRFSFVRQGILSDEGKSPRIEGTSVYSGWAQTWVQKFRVDAKVTRPGEPEPTEVVAGSDGNVVYLVDAKNKKVYADMDPAVLGAKMRFVRQSMMMYYVNPEAFEEEKKSAVKELKGMTRVGDEECYELRVGRAGGEGSSTWFLSARDFLPRRLELTFPAREGQMGGFSMVLSNLSVNPKFDKDPFQLAVPEGYTKTDEFAP